MYDVERTGANLAESTISPANVPQLTPVWSVPSNGSDFSAPIVVGGVVYYGSWNGFEYAVNASTGVVLWQTYLGVTNCDGGGYNPMGISSTPAYSGGTLYVGGGDGYWYALNATTGAVDWTLLPGSLSENYYNWASALVYNSALYIGTSSCFDNPLVPAGLLKVNLTTHAVVEEFNTTPPGKIGESIWTTPALDPTTNTVWVATGNENPPAYPAYANAIIGLNATTLQPLGSWQVPNVEGQDSDFGSTPTLFHSPLGTPMIVATNKNGVAYALDRANVSVNGTWGPVWNVSTGGAYSGAAFEGTTLYLGGSGTVYAVNATSGSVLWEAPMVGGGDIIGSLTWANGLVYAGGGGIVEAIDAANGSVLWSAPLPAGQSTVTEPVVENGMLFVASGDYGTNGQLTAYALQPWAVRFTATAVPPGKSWSASVGGATQTTTGSSLTFYEGNGTYDYTVRGPAGYRVGSLAPTGNLTVSGANLSQPLTFSRGSTLTVTFRESGLAHGSPWCVSLGGWSECPVKGSVSIKNLTPASYPYSVGIVANYGLTLLEGKTTVGRTGTLDLTSRSTTFSVHYALTTYTLTFQESGLVSGTRWSVKLVSYVAGHRHTTVHRGTGSTIEFTVGNGTYNYSAGAVKGFQAPAAGSVTVAGAAETVGVTYVPE